MTAGARARASSIQAVRGLADHPDTRLARQDDTEARADQPLIIGDDDRDRTGAAIAR